MLNRDLRVSTGQGYKCVVYKRLRSLISNSSWQRHFANSITMQREREVHPKQRLIKYHGLRTPREEIAFTARPKIHSHSQIFRYGGSIFCLPHRPIFSDILDLCLHWVSVVRDKYLPIMGRPCLLLKFWLWLVRIVYLFITLLAVWCLGCHLCGAKFKKGLYKKRCSGGCNKYRIPKNLGLGLNFRPCSRGYFLSGRP